MKPWTYKEVEMTSVDQFPEGTIGFVYKITNIHNGKFYIGKKNLYSTRTKALTKKELALITDKRKSKKKTVVKESDWQTYFGSNAELKKDIQKHGSDCMVRQVLDICSNKKNLTYCEIKHQILYGVLESDNSYNDNIQGRFFKKDI
jgi:hypothetical protein